MLATKDVELARETVRDLYARGQAARARAIEAVLAHALAGTEPSAGTPTEHLTLRQVARVLGVNLQTVEGWVAAGQLPADRIRGRLWVAREALQPYLERLRGRQQARPAPTPAEEAAAREQHDFIVTGLPPERVARLEMLIDKLQDGRRLSRGEREELAALERELAALAGGRIGEWTRQAARGPSVPYGEGQSHVRP